MNPRRILLAIVPGLVPWTVLLSPSSDTVAVDLVFAWGLLDPGTLHVVTIAAYVFEHTAGLPEYLLAWPTGVLLWLFALASVVAGVATGREDRRLTAGLFVLAGIATLRFSLGIGTRGGRIALPVATLLLWLLAWYDRPETWFR